jgi:hypothetical protein
MDLIISKNNSVRIIKMYVISHFLVTSFHEPVINLGRDRNKGGSYMGDYRWICRFSAVKRFR